jgi:hypothetical protein
VNGIHDLGGMHGFGPVDRDPNEPPFHGRWEAAVVAIMRATRGARVYNIDEFRHAIERMPAARYLASTYFERWLDGILRILDEKGVVTAAEMDARTGALEAPRAPVARPAVDHTATPRSGPRPRRRGSRRATPSSDGTSIPRATRGCHATRAASAA